MGKIKQMAIDVYDLVYPSMGEGNPFTEEELKRFEWEEQQQQQDEQEMAEDMDRYRDILRKELDLVLVSLTEDSMTRKYSSILCTDSIERVSRLIGYIDGGRIW